MYVCVQGKRPFWIQAIEQGKGVRGATKFTTVGKPKMAQKQYNSPMTMYSEDALEEIMSEGTLGLVFKFLINWSIQETSINFKIYKYTIVSSSFFQFHAEENLSIHQMR